MSRKSERGAREKAEVRAARRRDGRGSSEPAAVRAIHVLTTVCRSLGGKEVFPA